MSLLFPIRVDNLCCTMLPSIGLEYELAGSDDLHIAPLTRLTGRRIQLELVLYSPTQHNTHRL